MHRRRSIRLKGYDYTQPGAYFITVCAWQDLPRHDPYLQPRPYTPVRHALPELVRAFKSFSARRVIILRRSPGVPVWQRNYYEHIIRSEDEWRKIHDYILTNPARWDEDRENPAFHTQ